MSGARKVRLARTKISSNKRRLQRSRLNQPGTRATEGFPSLVLSHDASPKRCALLSMLLPHLVRHFLDLNGVLEEGIVAVPLDEIRPAHEGAVLGGSAVI